MSDAQCTVEITTAQINNEFVHEIIKKSGSNVRLCYQCHKCTAGCPIASFAMDDNPSALMHSIRLGLKERVIKSNSIWICASCKVCTTRCPQGIDVAKVMEKARNVAEREGITPPDRDIADFYKFMLMNISLLGRMYEPLLLGCLKSVGLFRGSTKYLVPDLKLGWDMFWKAKLVPWNIPLGGNTGELRKIIHRAEEQEEK